MRSFLVIILLFVSASPALAQQPPEPQTEAPTFRAGVELVRLDVRVTDANGRPIEDLRPEEIEIVEDGHVHPIVLFQHVHESAEPVADVARRTVAGEVSTNQGAVRGHLYVLVFDQQHITPGNEQRVRLAAERFLRERVRSVDRVALYALPGPGPQLDFTTDIDLAAAELKKIRGSLDPLADGSLGAIRIYEAYEIGRGNHLILNRVATRLAAEAAGDVFGPVGSRTSLGTVDQARTFEMLVQENARTVVAQADQRARSFLMYFADLVSALGRIEGRKTVMLFSEGFYADNVTRELEQVAAAAAQSYSVVHAFDLNRREVSLRESQSLGADQFEEIQSRLTPLGSLAVETAGELFIETASWTDRVFDRIADQAEDYYVVGFEAPSGAVQDRDRYRRVTVNVTREDARVSARTGYSLRAEATPADRRRAVDAALRAPYPQQALPVEYTTYVLRGAAPGRHRVVLSLTAGLPLAAPNRTTADVVFVVRSLTDGRVIASGTDVIPLPDGSDAGSANGIGEYRVQFEAPPGDYLMRAVVREPGGLAGSADRRFEVRRLDVPGVTASDLILGSPTARLPVRARAYTGGVLEGFIELYARQSQELEGAGVIVELAPVGEEPITSVAAELLEPVDAASGLTRGAQVEIPLEDVGPGAYVARATVRVDGQPLGEFRREVEVLPGPPPSPPAVATEDDLDSIGPREILRGTVARRYLESLRETAPSPRLADVAGMAADGAWDRVEMRLEMPTADAPAVHLALFGLARFAEADWVEAASALERALDADPTNAPTAFFLGWAFARMGDDRHAIGAWRNAAYLDPALVPAHLALANAYLKLSEPDLAAQALRTGLAALPDSLELRTKLAEVERR